MIEEYITQRHTEHCSWAFDHSLVNSPCDTQTVEMILWFPG